MTNDRNFEERTLDLPNDTTLPFFAYGIFKPGQIAYSKIRNHVDETINNIEINYEMKQRDGVPILINKEKDYFQTKGSIITFKEGRSKKAYDIISKTLLRKLYEWETIKISGKYVNVLFGVNPDNGSNFIEGHEESINFDGKNDPFFKDAIELIEKNLYSNENHRDIDSFFELQMNYMLLWSAIDRYSKLKYNRKKESWNHERFAKEKAFKEGIRKYEDDHHRPVYSTNDLRMHKFNADNPAETIEYYYTLRCNVVHRGKAFISDYSMLKKAAEELLEIFKEVLNDAFDEI